MEPIQLSATIYDIKAKRDGGSRITLDCGADSLSGIQSLLGLMANGEMALHVVIVPENVLKGEADPESGSEGSAEEPPL